MNGDDDDDRGNVPRRNLPSRHVRSEQSTSNHPTVLVSTNFQYIEYVAFYSEPVKRTFVRPNDVEKKSFFFLDVRQKRTSIFFNPFGIPALLCGICMSPRTSTRSPILSSIFLSLYVSLWFQLLMHKKKRFFPDFMPRILSCIQFSRGSQERVRPT